MLQWALNTPSKLIKYPGLKYQAPKLMYEPKDQANKPVVLIFGWLGAQERHLSKYTKLYHDKGTPRSFYLLFWAYRPSFPAMYSRNEL